MQFPGWDIPKVALPRSAFNSWILVSSVEDIEMRIARIGENIFL